MSARFGHASVHAERPEEAARALAELVGGSAQPFSPCPGAWVCRFSPAGFSGPFLELYPTAVRLSGLGDTMGFQERSPGPAGGGTHFNLEVERTREALEEICRRRGLPHGWRSWAGLLDVWLDDGLLIELVPLGG